MDRSVNSSLEDARDAIINACQDVIGAYAGHIHAEHNPGTLLLPPTLRLLPLLTLAVLKSVGAEQDHISKTPTDRSLPISPVLRSQPVSRLDVGPVVV